MTLAWKQPQLTVPPMGPTDEIRKLQHRLLFAYATYSKAKAVGVVESGVFDDATDQALRNIQAHIGGKVNLQPGVLTYDTKLALGVVVIAPAGPPPVTIVHFSIGGAGSAWDMGYPYDIGEQLDKGKCFHQPIGYDTTPFPMNRGVKTGVTELIRQLNLPRGPKGENCTTLPWCATAYSMGAIVFMTVLMRVLYGDLGQFKATYRGSNAFGNPMRQANHTLPGGIPVDGEGIVTPTAHDVPDVHWDFTADKGMIGSPGVDLYAKVGGAGKSDLSVKDMRAVWDIVNKGNPLNLALAIFNLVSSPTFEEGKAAFDAAWTAAQFFIFQGLSPHTTYQFTHPIEGDPRDCWQIALDHMRDVVAREPLRIAA